MSFQINVRAATKAEANAVFALRIASAANAHPEVVLDQEQVKAVVAMQIERLRDDETQDVTVNLSASGWGTDEGLNSAGLAIQAMLVSKQDD